ncbi:uncharacterized protein A1O5_06638 [Cladophialophora psammophila CBS 110553]|uniref:Azaphilone pigments biosynthesis cluster protein L N-terminal domain-containing protein n=1 Tax=Cladophialophora psammophila CBS 110553 TaxID=1182543 RepID=W9WRL6_9EURO|nr:uncharacterized protein A1O5_06638 [Cladophialophora psammophila CBS 110553]EXJ70568.1 hypothetical protein A1O5_06638 [Cladophialophora psammophila CBS 110553]
MDPLSIISTISAIVTGAFTLSSHLYNFVDDARNVNQTVIDLVQEVNALISILRAVKLGLESDPVKRAFRRTNSDDDRLLWESIQGSLNDCQATVDRLEKAIEDIRPERDNFVQQAARRIRLNLKDSEITAARAQFKTHTNALQMALLMVNLRAAYLAPDVVTNELGPKIVELRAFMELVYGSEADLRTRSLGIEPAYLAGLRQSAQRVISSATTVGVNSEATGSIWGEVMDEQRRGETLSWIPRPGIPEEPDTLRLAPPLSENYSGSQTTPSMECGARETESDSDGDFESEEVESFFARGTLEFDADNFEGAHSILQYGLELAEKLPFKRRQPTQIAKVKLMIATCIYHSSNLKEAEARLLPITQEMVHENETDEGAIRRCQASHLLAGTLLRQGRYSDAEVFCRKALIGRRRVLGKNHLSYFESLSLLSRIYEANGNRQHAINCWAMIPGDVASKLEKMKDEFPNMLQGRSSPPHADEIPPTRPPTGDDTGHPPSTSETPPVTITNGVSQIPPAGTSSAPLPSVASSILSNQIHVNVIGLRGHSYQFGSSRRKPDAEKILHP